MDNEWGGGASRKGVRANERVGGSRSGSGRTGTAAGRISHSCNGSWPPKIRRDQQRELLASEIADGGKGGGGTQEGRAGLMIKSAFSHDCSPRPNGGGSATRDDGLASMRSKGWTQSNGTRGLAGLGNEYS